jgi:hypothetical protein
VTVRIDGPLSTNVPVSNVRTLLRAFLALIGVAVLALVALVLSRRPSNDRDWSRDQVRLPVATFAGDSVRVHNVRDIRYRTTADYDVAFEDRAYDLRRLESVWFVVEPFSGMKGPAHTFVSFGFDDGQYVAISVEIRKEKEEHFSALKGALRSYELTYVVGDERDLIKLRSNYRRDSVYVYRTVATPQQGRALFVSMLGRANRLAEQPEFYNTLTSTCTTNIVRHVNEITPKRVPLSYKVLLPAYADELAYKVGLLDTTVPFETLRAAAKINERALRYADSSAFSRLIRSGA